MTDTPFHFLANYSAFKVLLVGSLAASSFLGTGWFLFDRLLGKGVPSHFALPSSMLLGLLAYSLVLQLTGFAHVISPELLRILLITQLGLGNALLLLILHSRKGEMNDLRARLLALLDSVLSSKTALLLGLLLALSLLVNLIIALAPSTKADEVYVYMHVPLRMLQDGGLFYERIAQIHIATFIPQLHYQLIAAPFYAQGLTDALNVVSWSLGALFISFLVGTIYEKTRSAVYALLISLGLYVGMHSPVWYVTGGAGAFSVLAMTMLTYFALSIRELLQRVGSVRALGMLSLLSVATAASKVAYLPVAILCLTIGAFFVWREYKQTNFGMILTISASFWVVFYIPAFLWSWGASGYAFGPMSDPANAAAVEEVALGGRSLFGVLYEMSVAVVELTPFVWGGCLLFFMVPWARRNGHPCILAAILVGTQILLFVWKLPLHFRYFGGLHFGLALFFWANSMENWRERFVGHTKRLYAVAAVLLVPWISLQLLYSTQFFPVVFRTQSASAFAERFVPFYADFLELDQILPEDAIILTRASIPVYAPRQVVETTDQIALLGYGRPIFLFGAPPSDEEWPSYSLSLVYENDSAVFAAFRTPRRRPTVGHLTVHRMDPMPQTR